MFDCVFSQHAENTGLFCSFVEHNTRFFAAVQCFYSMMLGETSSADLKGVGSMGRREFVSFLLFAVSTENKNIHPCEATK